MKVKEYICIIREQGGIMHITGQFKIPPKKKFKDIKSRLVAGRALNNAKTGEIVMVKT